MAGVKGRSGPPGNNNAGNEETMSFKGLMRAALNNGGRDRLRKGIDALIDKAEEGDQKALEFFADRIDGKPAQAIEMTGAEGGPVAMSLAVSFKRPDAD